MTRTMRWTLILGCLALIALQAPRSSLVLLEDLRGPYPLAEALDDRPPEEAHGLHRHTHALADRQSDPR